MYSISSPAGLLSTIPVHLGRYPENSVVAMTVSGKAIGATLRVDKPAVMDAEWMAQFVSYLAHAPAEKVALAVFSSGHPEGGHSPHYEAEVNTLADYITAHLPVTVMIAALITRDYWLDYADGMQRPALELEASSVVMEMVANGDAFKNQRTIPGVLADQEFHDAVLSRSLPFGEFETERLFALFNSLVTAGTLPSRDEAVRIVAGMEGGTLRDGLLCRIFQDHVDGEDYSNIMLGKLTSPFDRPRYDAGLALMNHLLTLDAPAAHRASMLAGLGWLRWHAGHGSDAVDCFDAALAADPDNRLAYLLKEVVHARSILSPLATVKSHWVN